jgi:hypothetical protein
VRYETFQRHSQVPTNSCSETTTSLVFSNKKKINQLCTFLEIELASFLRTVNNQVEQHLQGQAGNTSLTDDELVVLRLQLMTHLALPKSLGALADQKHDTDV